MNVCCKISAFINELGQLAQGLARFLHTEEVTGSNPVLPTKIANNDPLIRRVFYYHDLLTYFHAYHVARASKAVGFCLSFGKIHHDTSQSPSQEEN